MAFGDLQQNASAVSLDEPEQIDIQEVDESGDSPLLDDVADDADTEGTEAPDQAEAQELIGPDSLIEGDAGNEDAEAQSLKSSGGRSRIYLSCYGGTPENERYGRNWCPAYVQDKPVIQAWANKQGLTSSEANADGYRYAFVRWVDVLRDKPSRDLRYGANQAVYPVYVITDQHGCELWHHVGSLPIGYLESKWKEAHYMRRREAPQRLSRETSETVPVPPKDPVIVASSAGSCGPNGCKVSRKKKPRF
ncbi:MAG: hypothetical protein E6R03_04920 [Hyphomicrobiaceae bacterium]|nr:MAG: hypothetical protein E6R03_04920 [Hyphomicrobiaceae bacterium]